MIKGPVLPQGQRLKKDISISNFSSNNELYIKLKWSQQLPFLSFSSWFESLLVCLMRECFVLRILMLTKSHAMMLLYNAWMSQLMKLLKPATNKKKHQATAKPLKLQGYGYLKSLSHKLPFIIESIFLLFINKGIILLVWSYHNFAYVNIETW